MLNPLGLLSSGAKSSVALCNAAILVAIASAQRGRALLSAAAIAFAAYLSLYPIMLISPLALMVARRRGALGVALLLLGTGASLAGLLFASHRLVGSWRFLEEVYGFTLTVPDLTPNVGFFWYFFTEVFSTFKPLFLWSFQLHIALYWLPLSLTLRYARDGAESALACLLIHFPPLYDLFTIARSRFC